MQRRAVNISTAELDGLFVDELALLQPSAGYMRVVRDRILYTRPQVVDEQRERSRDAHRRTKALTDKLDHLDEAFLFTAARRRPAGCSHRSTISSVCKRCLFLRDSRSMVCDLIETT
jgi:hypothetical protein